LTKEALAKKPKVIEPSTNPYTLPEMPLLPNDIAKNPYLGKRGINKNIWTDFKKGLKLPCSSRYLPDRVSNCTSVCTQEYYKGYKHPAPDCSL